MKKRTKQFITFLIAVAVAVTALPGGLVKAANVSENYLKGIKPTVSGRLSNKSDETVITDGVTSSVDYNNSCLVTAENNSASGLKFVSFSLEGEKTLNQVKVYYDFAESLRRPADVAVDVKLANGRWKRVAEKHEIANNERILTFNFAPAACTQVKVSCIRTSDSMTLWAIAEMEAYLDENVKEADYTGTTPSEDPVHNIPYIINNEFAGAAASTETPHDWAESADVNRGVKRATDGDTKTDAIISYGTDNLGYYQIGMNEATTLNQIKIVYDGNERERHPEDIAIDVLNAGGSWTRVAEQHAIDWRATEVLFTFAPVTTTTVRVTGNSTRNKTAYEGLKKITWRLMEIEAYMKDDVTEADYTGVTADENAAYNIAVPEAIVANAFAGLSFTASNTLDGYPASRLTDGVTSANADVKESAITQYDDKGIAYYEVELSNATVLNQVRLFFNKAEVENRPLDIAIDVEQENGQWKRVAEMHNIAYNDSHKLYFNFEQIAAKKVRVSASRIRNAEVHPEVINNFRLMEIEGCLNPEVTSANYTGTTADAERKYNIPVAGTEFKNLLEGCRVTTNKVESFFTEKFPVENLVDGKKVGDIPNAIINYQANFIGWYEVTLKETAKVNTVKLYFSYFEPEKRPLDLAVDVYAADGKWHRVAEYHNIDYTQVLKNNIMSISFAELDAKNIRVTANARRNRSENFRLAELEAGYDGSITEADYAAVQSPDEAKYKLPMPEGAPATGDVSNAVLPATTCLMGLFGIAALLVWKKKSRVF